MKARDSQTGLFKKVFVKALDSLPVGSEIDFNGPASDIPVGWELSDASDDYSTDETFTGKYWIDGKKIYRKVFTGGPYAEDYSTLTLQDNVDDLISVYGWLQGSGGAKQQVGSPNNWAVLTSNGVVEIRKSNTATISHKVTLEYTKTTD